MAISSLAATPTTTNTAAATSTSAISSLSGNFQTFLKLLMTQLQNQDPTSPLDTNQFTSQLVQFASVEQQINTNKSLGELIELTQSGQVLQSSAMVGRQVEVQSEKLSLQNGGATVRFTAATDGPVAVAVYSDSGAKIADGLVNATRGNNEWTWNGRNGNGVQMRDGAYRVAVTGSIPTGPARRSPSLSWQPRQAWNRSPMASSFSWAVSWLTSAR